MTNKLGTPSVILFGVLFCVAVGACGDSKETTQKSPQPTRRVDAVKAPDKKISLDAFCDVRASQKSAPEFALPPLAENKAPETQGWRWLNVWATWCKPCIEEMPRLRSWQERLKKDGYTVSMQYLSVDSSAEVVQKFRKKHPEIPDSVRIREFGMLEQWFATVGLDAGATIPIHVFVNPAGKVRCVRTGAVDEPDYAIVEALLEAG